MKRSTDQLQKFFEITGSETDSLIFLKNFRSIDPEKFLLICIDTEIVSDSFSTFFYDLKMLHSLGLYPIILLSQDSISYIDLFFKGVFDSIKNSAKNEDAQFEIIPFGKEAIGEVKASIEKKTIPFVVLESEENLFESVAFLTSNLYTSKFLLLSAKGALKKKHSSEKISIINIRSDYARLVKEDCLLPEDLYLLDQIKVLLENRIAHTMNIAVASPATMLKELFTVNGSGTFIKLGSEIRHISTVKSVDKVKLNQLLESAFRKTIDPIFLDSRIDSLFLEVNYRGAAILKETQYGFLLSKFAVDEIARGEGIGRDLWNEMKKLHKTIFWRANPRNQIHKWYSNECQGMDRGVEWNVYWINLEVEKIPEVCKYLRLQPQDFIL